MKDEAPRDAGFSETKHLPVPGSKVSLCSPACWGGEEAMKVRACSDFIRGGKRRGQQSSAPRPSHPRQVTLGVHLKLISTDIKHTLRVQAGLLTGRRIFPLTPYFCDWNFGRSTKLSASLTASQALQKARPRSLTPSQECRRHQRTQSPQSEADFGAAREEQSARGGGHRATACQLRGQPGLPAFRGGSTTPR